MFLRIRIVWYTAVCLCFLCSDGAAKTGLTRVPTGLFQEASGFILEGRYKEAEEAFDRFINSFPDEPAGPLMKAAVVQNYSIDYNDFSDSDEYFQLLDSAEKLARDKIEKNGNDVWAQFYLHSASILKAVWAVNTGNFITGIIKGKSGINGMSDIVSANQDFYDAYLMIGSYKFWKSEAFNKFYWLPLIEDHRNQGIDEVKKALTLGTLISPLSSIVLNEMLIVYDLELAIHNLEELVRMYPSCRLFRWQLGESLKKAGSYDKAVRVLTGIAEEMKYDPNDDGSGPLRCWWKLAVLTESLGKYDECRRYCEEIIRIGQKKTVYERQKKRIEGARKLLEKIERR
ncbi:tetratricopeptide repeat protein [Candidatus Latescibacterota bacterium]